MAKMTPQDRQIHQQFAQYGQNAREWMRKCLLLLPEIERREIWKKRGCASIYEYAAKLAGMSRNSVDDALRIMNKVEKFPALREVLERKGLNRVRPVLSIVNKETEKFWAEKSGQMSKNTLETYVKNFRLEFRTSTGAEPENIPIMLSLPRGLVQDLQEAQKHPRFNEALGVFLKEFKRRNERIEVETPSENEQKVHGKIGEPGLALESGKGSQSQSQSESKSELNLSKISTLRILATPKILSLKIPSRHIPNILRRQVLERTSGQCAYPRCMKPATSLHHTQRWALEKVHDPQRLHGLCTPHERLAHLGLIEHEEASPKKWKLRTEADPSHFKSYVDQFVGLYRPT